MESLRFEGSTVEQCLIIASDRLKVPIEEIKYTVLEERKGLFRRRAEILVQLDICCDDENNGKVAVKEGKVIVKNPKGDGKPAEIIPGSNVKVTIDGKEVKARHEVLENCIIEIYFDETEAKRYLDFKISSDRMQAYVNIKYEPEIVYTIEEQDESCSITLEAIVKERRYPSAFTNNEIQVELTKLGLKYGIIEGNLEKCISGSDLNSLLLAQGLLPKDDEDDYLEIKFNQDNSFVGFKEDESGRVDYKNVGSIQAVKNGDIIAIKHEGHQEGQDGIDVYGATIKKKNRHLIDLRVGKGCILKDGKTVIADMGGKPYIKNGTFYVFEIHEILEDVDLKTGNVKFIGDVKVFGGVKEGMVVEAGNAIEIEKNVENAKLVSKGNIEVKGNVISSKILSGGQDVLILSYFDRLNALVVNINSMISTIMEIKRNNIVGQKVSDGELIKALMESRFKDISKLCVDIVEMSKVVNSSDSKVVKCIKEKLIGRAPLDIKHFSQLDLILETLKQNMDEMKSLVSLPVNVKVSYCQDSSVESSGDIYITGRGEYVSNIIAHGSIYFISEKSVARGGFLSAKNEIRCKLVGSSGGVATRLMVSEKGHIWIDEAYHNTVIIVGQKELTLEIPCKNVHAYIDDNLELIVDRLKL